MSELMDQIHVGDTVTTDEGYRAVVEEKLEALNLLSISRVECGRVIWGVKAPSEVVVVKEL